MEENKVNRLEPTGKSLNPSFADIERIADKELAKSVGKIQDTPATPVVETKDNIELKKTISKYEPEPVPFKLITGGRALHPKFPNAVTKDGTIMVRRISAFEEVYIDQFLSATETQIPNLITNILDGCIKSNFPVSELPIIDKIPLFFFILAISYGSHIEIGPIENCKTCIPGTTKVKINFLTDFKINHFPEENNSVFQYPKVINLTSYPEKKITAIVEMPVVRDEKVITEMPSNKEDLIIKLRAIITKINGFDKETTEAIEPSEWNEILAFLSTEDKNKIREALDSITAEYGISYAVKLDAKHCSNENCSMLSREVTLSIQDILIGFMMKTKDE